MGAARRALAEAGAGLVLAAALWWTAGAADPARPAALSAAAAGELWERAVAARDAEDLRGSLQAVERLLGAFPHEPRYLAFEAETFQGLGRPLDAARAWELYALSAPFPTEACPHLGRDYQNAGRPDLALDAHRRCLAMDPTKPDLMIHLAGALAAAGRDDEAARLLQEVRRRAPQDADAPIALARLALKHGDADGARARLAPVLKERPDDTDALVLSAQISLAAGDPGAARASLLRAAVSSPRYGDLHRLLLRAQNELHDEAGAAKTRATLAELEAEEKGLR